MIQKFCVRKHFDELFCERERTMNFMRNRLAIEKIYMQTNNVINKVTPLRVACFCCFSHVYKNYINVLRQRENGQISVSRTRTTLAWGSRMRTSIKTLS